MKDIYIREARKEDCPQILQLIKNLALYEKAPDKVTVTLTQFEDSGFGEQHPVWWAYVAEAGGIVCGFALYYIRYSTWKGQQMYLEDFYVEPELRGVGIGAMLFDKLIHVAKEQRFNGIVWQALEWNEPALNFYRKYNAKFDYEWVNCSIDF